MKGAGADLLIGLALSAMLSLALHQLAGAPGVVVIQALAIYFGLAVLVLLGLGRGALVRDMGSANRVTLLRGVIAAVFAGLVFHGDTVADHAWWLVAGATAALVLDGVDGWVARRTGASSAFGARFDMEVDAFFILVLAALALELGKAGPWVLLMGLLRYLFVVSGLWLPALRGTLPASLRRKTVCVVQGGVLAASLAPIIGPKIATPALAVALILLIYSFAVDSILLLRSLP